MRSHRWRFADDLVILIDAYPRHDWLLPAVEKRLREELAAIQVEINEEKSRIVAHIPHLDRAVLVGRGPG